MRSPYAVLGVDQGAEPKIIKSAYRSLAKVWHPDQNPGDPLAGSKFAEITQAYRLLIDPEARARFDTGTRTSANSNTSPFATFRDAWRQRGARAKAEPTEPGARQDAKTDNYADLAGFDAMVKHIFGDEADAADCAKSSKAKHNDPDDPLAALDELFAKWRAIHRSQPEPEPRARTTSEPTRELHPVFELGPEAAFTGAEVVCAIEKGVEAAIRIPPGLEDGAIVETRTSSAGKTFKIIGTVRYRDKAGYRVEGSNLHMDAAIELSQAVLGGSTVIQSLDGPARIKLSEWSSGHEPVVVKGRGLPAGQGRRGDLIVHLGIRLPEHRDEHLVEMMQTRKRAFFV